MVEKPSAFQNFLQIENQLNIKKVVGINVWMCFYSSVTIYNSIALILCIDCLNMPFNVNKVTMITVSDFLTISLTVIQTLNQREF